MGTDLVAEETEEPSHVVRAEGIIMCEYNHGSKCMSEITRDAAADPPDELVEIPRRRSPLPPLRPQSEVPLLGRWTAALQSRRRTRLCLAALTPFFWVAIGNGFPYFLIFVTSELGLMTWVLVEALMNRGIPLQPQLQGTLATVKVAIGLLYPGATRWVDCLHQLCVVVLPLMQDLCVSVFALVALSAVSHFTSPTTSEH